MKRIGAALLQTEAQHVDLRDSSAYGPNGNVSLRDIARAYYIAPSELPGEIDPHGLEVTGGFSPTRTTGMHTGAAHACVIAVDPRPVAWRF